MANRSRMASIALATLLATQALPAFACSSDSRCEIGNGYYRVLTPPGWDGKSSLPALVFFHGYRMKAEDIISDPDFLGFVKRSGVMLIAPNGEGGTWSHTGSPAKNRDEIAFLGAVLDDAQQRFPIDGKKLWASGFSQGGAMVWDAACYLGNRFVAFAPISGTWWKPQPETCPTGPQNIRHVHGLGDRQVPIEGRAIRTTFHQGNTREGLATWRKMDGCPAEPLHHSTIGNLTCDIWSACSTGREVQFCTHPGGHDLDPAWLDQAWSWIGTLPKR